MTKARRKRSPIRHFAERQWPVHEDWVSGLPCCIPGCRRQPIEVAHIRSAANSGTGIKPHACFVVPLCQFHHAEQHALGQPAFARRHGIDLILTAINFYHRSPDRGMKEALKNVANQWGIANATEWDDAAPYAQPVKTADRARHPPDPG